METCNEWTIFCPLNGLLSDSQLLFPAIEDDAISTSSQDASSTDLQAVGDCGNVLESRDLRDLFKSDHTDLKSRQISVRLELQFVDA